MVGAYQVPNDSDLPYGVLRDGENVFYYTELTISQDSRSEVVGGFSACCLWEGVEVFLSYHTLVHVVHSGPACCVLRSIF